MKAFAFGFAVGVAAVAAVVVVLSREEHRSGISLSRGSLLGVGNRVDAL